MEEMIKDIALKLENVENCVVLKLNFFNRWKELKEINTYRLRL